MVALAALVVATAPAGADSYRKVTSVVRTDLRTGRLVRSVVVQPKVVAPKVIEPKVVSGEKPAGGEGPDPGPDAGLNEIIEHMARKYEVDPLLVHSLIKVESNYNQYALSRAGAEGLMQLMPSTARRFGVSKSYDARRNIEGGVKYLKYLQDLYGKDLRRILAAYNAGEGAVSRYNGIPRYAETEFYVYQVAKRFFEAKNRQKAQAVRNDPVAASTPEQPREPRPVEAFVDDNGRLHLRTK